MAGWKVDNISQKNVHVLFGTKFLPKPRNKFIQVPPRPDCNGKNSGSDFAFLYPDLTTALFGHWEDGFLVTARPARLDNFSLQPGGTLEPSFSLLDPLESRQE